MTKNAKLITLAALVLLGSLSLADQALAGFGVSPPKIREDRLIKGSQVERTVYLVQGSPVADLDVEVTVDESEISDWITFHPGKIFTIPAGTQQYPLEVLIDVPDDAELGVYRTSVRVSQKQNSTESQVQGGGVSVVVGIVVNIEIEVGEGLFYSFAVKDLNFHDINSAEFPKVDLRIENLGNIPAGPQSAEFQLFNKYDDRRLAVIQGVEIERVDPFKTEKREVEFPIGVSLAPGEYWGHLYLYDNNELVKEYKDIFSVTEASFAERYSQLIMIGAIAIVILIVVIFLLSFSYKRLHEKHKAVSGNSKSRTN